MLNLSINTNSRKKARQFFIFLPILKTESDNHRQVSFCNVDYIYNSRKFKKSVKMLYTNSFSLNAYYDNNNIIINL